MVGKERLVGGLPCGIQRGGIGGAGEFQDLGGVVGVEFVPLEDESLEEVEGSAGAVHVGSEFGNEATGLGGVVGVGGAVEGGEVFFLAARFPLQEEQVDEAAGKHGGGGEDQHRAD